MGSEGFSLFYWGLTGCLPPPPPPQLGMKAAGTDRSGGNEGSPGGSYLPGLLTSSLTALKCQMDPALLLSPHSCWRVAPAGCSGHAAHGHGATASITEPLEVMGTQKYQIFLGKP